MRTFVYSLFGQRNASQDCSDDSEMNASVQKPSKNEPWIGVDLDGTLAHYDSWRGPKHIGRPVPVMMARVRNWLASGVKVKIFTARASHPDFIPPIERWLRKNGLEGLEITNSKDLYMVELWDDRCVQVIQNSGNAVLSPSIMARPRSPLLEESRKDMDEILQENYEFMSDDSDEISKVS